VLFMHNSGYSTMCGHAVIAIGRWAVEEGLVPVKRPVTEFGLECPCGVVRVAVEGDATGPGAVRFESVPAFAYRLDATAGRHSFGRVTFDIAFGGAFYAILPASRLGLSLGKSPLERLIAAGREITAAGRAELEIVHPEAPDLAFLYGTILTDDVAPDSPTPT